MVAVFEIIMVNGAADFSICGQATVTKKRVADHHSIKNN